MKLKLNNIKNIKYKIKKSAEAIHYEYLDAAPWYKLYEDLNIPRSINYPEKTLYEIVEETATHYPSYYAYEYFGKQCTYAEFIEKIKRCAKSFQKIGVKENDRVTICMPNTPEGIISVYALNLIGAVANMVHPLSSASELEFCLTQAKSKYLLLWILFMKSFEVENIKLNKVIISKANDSMNTVTSFAYWVTSEEKLNYLI